jgi:hypothetical protein
MNVISASLAKREWVGGMGLSMVGYAARLVKDSFTYLKFAVAALFWLTQPAAAQELLVNRSFETPVAPLSGNNFYTAANYATVGGWTVTGTLANPVNVIKPTATYNGGPTVAQNGTQYFDVNSSAGTARQIVTIPSDGLIDFSTFFSTRDGNQTVSGFQVNIRRNDAAQTIVYSVAAAFTTADPLYSWKRAGLDNQPIAAGTYIFELILPDPGNADTASLVFKPPLNITKASVIISDPINGTSNPKFIPGAVAEYVLTVSNPASYAVSPNSLLVIDKTPANLEFALADIAGAAGPIRFVQGAPSSALTYTFTSLASSSDDLEFSYDATGTTWTGSPSAAAIASGYDPAITFIRLSPKGSMAAGSSFQVRLRYRIK